MPTRVLLEGPQIEPLLAQAREEYGAGVRIISADKVRVGGLGGFFAKQRYELSVEVPDDLPEVRGAGPVEDPAGRPVDNLLALLEAKHLDPPVVVGPTTTGPSRTATSRTAHPSHSASAGGTRPGAMEQPGEVGQPGRIGQPDGTGHDEAGGYEAQAVPDSGAAPGNGPHPDGLRHDEGVAGLAEPPLRRAGTVPRAGLLSTTGTAFAEVMASVGGTLATPPAPVAEPPVSIPLKAGQDAAARVRRALDLGTHEYPTVSPAILNHPALDQPAPEWPMPSPHATVRLTLDQPAPDQHVSNPHPTDRSAPARPTPDHLTQNEPASDKDRLTADPTTPDSNSSDHAAQDEPTPADDRSAADPNESARLVADQETREQPAPDHDTRTAPAADAAEHDRTTPDLPAQEQPAQDGATPDHPANERAAADHDTPTPHPTHPTAHDRTAPDSTEQEQPAQGRNRSDRPVPVQSTQDHNTQIPHPADQNTPDTEAQDRTAPDPDVKEPQETEPQETEAQETEPAPSALDPAPDHGTPEQTQDGATATAPLAPQLVDLGLPETLAAQATGSDSYRAILHALAGVPVAPAAPADPGDVLVIAGELPAALALARQVAASLRLGSDKIVLAGASTTSATGTGVPAERHITGVEDARRRARRMQVAKAAHIVVLETPVHGDLAWTRSVCTALAPSAVWAAVDATRKTAETVRQLRSLGTVDAIAVYGAADCADPASVLGLGVPVALLDGRPADPHAWAALLSNLLYREDNLMYREDGDRAVACS
ncbi:MAG TPA: hypothetical protein VJT31_09180 [Rugosimonospora sp.]|nr:hypothetical protein [Rugosimonospora sp.]